MTKRFLFLTISILFLLTTSFSNRTKQVSEKVSTHNAYSILTDITLTVEQGGFGPQLHIHLEANLAEPYYWEATINVHVYYFGGTGYWTPKAPGRISYWVPQWGYGWLQFNAEIPSYTESGDTYIDLPEEYDDIDGEYALVSWVSEQP